MSDRFKEIYRCRAEMYERLVAREDQHGNLFEALIDIVPLEGLDVVEFGAGTGRLTRILSLMAGRVSAFDIESAMLAEASLMLPTTGMSNWSLAIGDNANMPVTSNCADVVLEGWSFAHVTEWHPQDWREQTDLMLAEMRRILKPGGMALLIETLGTGRRRPQAPTPELAKLYQYWQASCGFDMRWIRTDYQFASRSEADELVRFFFGDAAADEWLSLSSVILPECTGIWWRRF